MRFWLWLEGKSITQITSVTGASLSPHWQSWQAQTSLLFQPKLSVRLEVEALCWSTSNRLANSLWSSSGITLTWGEGKISFHHQASVDTPAGTLQYLHCSLVFPYPPDIPIHLAPNWRAPLQKQTKTNGKDAGPQVMHCNPPVLNLPLNSGVNSRVWSRELR